MLSSLLSPSAASPPHTCTRGSLTMLPNERADPLLWNPCLFRYTMIKQYMAGSDGSIKLSAGQHLLAASESGELGACLLVFSGMSIRPRYMHMGGENVFVKIWPYSKMLSATLMRG